MRLPRGEGGRRLSLLNWGVRWGSSAGSSKFAVAPRVPGSGEPRPGHLCSNVMKTASRAPDERQTGSPPSAWRAGRLLVEDLGRIAYQEAYQIQLDRVNRQIERREEADPPLGTLLLLEHDPVITVSRRPDARKHLLATPELLATHGVTVAETDRGGDITYHGPGQLVAYPILPLAMLGLRVGEYLRLLEQVVIDLLASFGVAGERDDEHTGVWVRVAQQDGGSESRKICALGVRVRRGVTLHGLALNVTTDLSHFDTIVPCGIADRGVTSLEQVLGPRTPTMDRVKQQLVATMASHVRRLAEATAGDAATR